MSTSQYSVLQLVLNGFRCTFVELFNTAGVFVRFQQISSSTVSQKIHKKLNYLKKKSLSQPLHEKQGHSHAFLIYWNYVLHNLPFSSPCKRSDMRNGHVYYRYTICTLHLFAGIGLVPLICYKVGSLWPQNVCKLDQFDAPPPLKTFTESKHGAAWFLPQWSSISACCSSVLWPLRALISLWRI